MIERIKLNLLMNSRQIIEKIGSYGSAQMCAGFFHEIKVPKELEEELEKELEKEL